MWRQDHRFELPAHLIARRPSPVRGESRLLDVPLDGASEIRPFAALLESFRGDEVLVLNDTRVVPARVFGQKQTGGAIELLLTEVLGPGRVLAMVRGKKLRAGTLLRLPAAEGRLLNALGDGIFEIELRGVEDVYAWLETVGEVPLPPYLERAADADDKARYQTVFARHRGAVAAPTAGLHFTDELLRAIRDKGVLVHTLTLHVGLGTFLPLRGDDLDELQMHVERFEVPAETALAVRSGRPVIAVGTTVVRALEAHARDPEAASTRIFIREGFDFRVVDGLVTNFHLPESSLLLLVCAFAGRARVLDAYAQAVAAELRFFSYGDASLLRRPGGRWT